MARKSIKRKASSASRNQFQPRDLLLAGIGAVSLGRERVIHAYANGFEGVAGLRGRAEDAVQGATRKVLALAMQAKAQARTRLVPVLASLGLKPAPVKHSPARKKPAAARSRKAA